MAILGQASSILYGTTAPSNTNVIWAQTSTNDSNTWVILGYFEYLNGSWERLSGIHEGATAPSDLTKIWKKPNGQTFSLNVYDSSSSTWINMLNIPSKVVNADFTVDDDSFSGSVISNQGANNIIGTLESTIPVDTIFLVERIGTGTLTVTVNAPNKINGVIGASFEILNQFTSISVRCYAAGEFIVEGNTI